MLETKHCNCGNTEVGYHNDENQHEPACWECYYQARENNSLMSPSEMDYEMMQADVQQEEDHDPFPDDLPF